MRHLWITVLGLSLACAGCGGEGTTCEQLAAAMCTQLVECPEMLEMGECSYLEPPSRRLGINCGVCEAHFTRAFCSDTTKTETFFRSCLDAASQAECTTFDGDNALRLPQACRGLLECGAGPCQN